MSVVRHSRVGQTVRPEDPVTCVRTLLPYLLLIRLAIPVGWLGGGETSAWLETAREVEVSEAESLETSESPDWLEDTGHLPSAAERLLVDAEPAVEEAGRSLLLAFASRAEARGPPRA